MAKDNPSDKSQPDAGAQHQSNEHEGQPRGLGRASLDTVQTATLMGDVRDLILQEMRDAKNALPWTTRSEKEQQEMIERAETFAKNLIRRTVEAVAAQEFPSIHAKIEKWTVTPKGLQINLSGHAGEANLQTMIEGGALAHVVFADVEDLMGEREPVVPLPDQPALGDDDPDGPIFDRTDAGRK